MLKNLYIENIAVIEKTTIDFTEGLNVLTGETGAGKSVIIGSINAILGNRISRDLIRNGCENAFVSAEFCDISSKASETLVELGFEPEEDGTVLIQREIHSSGKGKCRINGRPATTGVLKSVGAFLINIHGQHENYELMSPELHITYIDRLGNLLTDLSEYRAAYKEYTDLKSKLNKAELDDRERKRKADLLMYQINEIESADLYSGEYEELTEQRNILENMERIAESLNETKEYLNGSDETVGAVQALEMACSSLSNICDVLPDAENLVKRIQNAIYEIEDCRDEVFSMCDTADSDGGNLEEIEDRIDLIKTLGKKYGPSIDEILSFLENARKELEYLEKYEENQEKLAEKCEQAYTKACELASELSKKRQKTAVKFSDAVKEEMTFLDMPNVNLLVRIDKCELNSYGCDDIEILISTNPGEPPKPVAKIASGGELSRMMLAVKNVLADKDDTDTLIFDEVDTGISGSTAQKVGLKLKEVSKNRQVLCVTHLAQIAGLADTHFKIQKSVSSGQTYTSVNMLDYEGRKNELARIIGGVEITKATLDYAEEMLNNK